MDKELINTIGFWVLRIIVAITGIYFLTKGNSDYALSCGAALALTFIYESVFA